MTIEAHSASRHAAICDRYWYYSMELAPGILTPGQKLKNVVLVRRLLERCQVEGLRCLDVCTVEGLVPALLSRRGAAEVVATDVVDDHREKVDYLLALPEYGAEFTYVAPVALEGLAGLLSRVSRPDFDLVVFSGVLYHVFGPLNALCAVRSLVRPGGIMVVETTVTVQDAPLMIFNAAGSLTPELNTFWYPSTACLDYLLRYLKLEPLKVAHLQSARAGICRVAVACRAVEEVPAEPGDGWMAEATRAFDYQSFIRWDLNAGCVRAPVAYQAEEDPALYHLGGRGVDVHRAVTSQAALVVRDEDTYLRLADRF